MSDEDLGDIGQYGENASIDAKLAAQTEASDFQWLVADPRGRRFMRRLLDRAGVFRVSFTGDALGTAFREGERNVGLGLVAYAQEHAPAELAEILTKGANESRR